MPPERSAAAARRDAMWSARARRLPQVAIGQRWTTTRAVIMSKASARLRSKFCPTGAFVVAASTWSPTRPSSSRGRSVWPVRPRSRGSRCHSSRSSCRSTTSSRSCSARARALGSGRGRVSRVFRPPSTRAGSQIRAPASAIPKIAATTTTMRTGPPLDAHDARAGARRPRHRSPP